MMLEGKIVYLWQPHIDADTHDLPVEWRNVSSMSRRRLDQLIERSKSACQDVHFTSHHFFEDVYVDYMFLHNANQDSFLTELQFAELKDLCNKQTNLYLDSHFPDFFSQLFAIAVPNPQPTEPTFIGFVDFTLPYPGHYLRTFVLYIPENWNKPEPAKLQPF